MKTNELMLNDWVYYGGKEQMPCRVRTIIGNSIKFDNGTPQDWMSEVKNFTPIPLTAEILKKNGFVEFMPHNWQIVIDNIMIELREPQHNMAIWLDWTEHDTGTYASYILPSPNCVHELQHALRLCNIEKEIEL